MSDLPIYLDHAATTPLAPEVAAAMQRCLEGPAGLGNASSVTHFFGREAAAAVEAARAAIASLIDAPREDLLFTSGATESDNLAILGITRGRADRGRHLISSRTEHKAVLDTCKALQKRGWSVSFVEPTREGRIEPEAVLALLRPDTQLVSIMHANNETGVVQDIAAIAAALRASELGREVFLHCDAAQSVGKLPVSVRKLGVDLLSFSAHKFHGPKGVGALYLAPRARPWLEPLMWGGGQERGLRPGTLPTPLIVGFGAAATLAATRLESDAVHVAGLAESFREALRGVEGLRYNEPATGRLPGLVSLSVEGVEGESLLAALPKLALSSGSACDSASAEPSYVLRASGLAPELAQATLRVSFGRDNTTAQALEAARQIRAAIEHLRGQDAPGEPEGGPWFVGSAGSLREGAKIRCFLRLETQGATPARIAALQFRAATCPDVWRVLEGLSAAALASPATEVLQGGALRWRETFAVPKEKLGRLLLVEDAWRAAWLNSRRGLL